MKFKHQPFSSYFLLITLLFSCVKENSDGAVTYSKQKAFLDRVTKQAELQQEEPLQADTFALLKKTVAILEKAETPKYYAIKAHAFLLWAAYSFIQGEEKEIPQYLEKAEKMLSGKKAPEDLMRLAEVCSYWGMYYSSRKEEMGSSISYKLKALTIFKQLKKNKEITTEYINLGTAYARSGKYSMAINYFDSARVYLNKTKLGTDNFINHCGLYFNLGYNLTNQAVDWLDEGQIIKAKNGFSKALTRFKEAENILKQFPLVDTRNIQFFIYQNITRVFIENGDRQQTDQLLHYARALVKLQQGNTQRETSHLSLAYGALAVALSRNKDMKGAIEAIEQGYRAQQVLQVGSTEMTYNKFNYMRFLYLHALTLKECSNQTGDKSYLVQCLKTYEKNLAFMDMIRRDFVSEEGEERLNKTFVQYAGKASAVAISIYEATKDQQYLEKAFSLSERSKAISMRRSLTEMETSERLPEMDTIIKIEHSFRQSITDLDSRLYQANSSLRRQQIRDSLILIRRQYEDFIERLKKSKNNLANIYYKNSYDSAIPHIKAIQANFLDDKTACIEYQFHAGEGFAFVISKHQFDVVKIPFSAELLQLISSYKENLSYELPLTNYIQCSSELYNILLKHTIDSLLPANIEHLVIVSGAQQRFVPLKI